MNSDNIILSILEILLIFLSVYAVCKDLYSLKIKTFKKGLSLKAEVDRSKESLQFLFAAYAGWVFINVGFSQKLSISWAVLNIILGSYLFLFSSWFRNQCLFRLFSRIKRD
jgi:hypothetical protein